MREAISVDHRDRMTGKPDPEDCRAANRHCDVLQFTGSLAQ